MDCTSADKGSEYIQPGCIDISTSQYSKFVEIETNTIIFCNDITAYCYYRHDSTLCSGCFQIMINTGDKKHNKFIAHSAFNKQPQQCTNLAFNVC